MPDLTPLDDDEEDAWSYSFPPSTESLPILQQSQSKRSTTQPSNSTFRTSQNGDTSLTNLQMKLLIDTTTTSSKSSLPFPSTIQKSIPLDPLTTKEDANSVISKDSKGNALNEASQTDDKPKFMKDLEEYGSTRNISNSPLSQQSTNGTNLLPSPKFISYRKSKRTVSEGTFDSMLDKSPMSPPASRYDPKLYVDEFYKTSKFRYATIKRNIDFHNNFHSLDLTDRLVDDFACALSREILLQGRIYLSESYICFNSNLLGWVTNLVIQLEEVVKIEKRSTAGLFPNAISIETVDGTLHTFASFLSRDQTYELMLTLWKGKTGKSNNDLTLTSEDELENNAIDSPNKNIESYILSLDGDDEEDNDVQSLDNSGEDEEEEESELDIEEVLSTKLIKLKSESPYTNNGPDAHAPTTANYEKLEAEIELVDEVIDAPMGIVFAILFGPYTKFQTNFLETHDGSEISEISDFRPSEEDPAVLERKYIYRRALGYSIGPKSTKCEVTETIEHLNFADYIVVVSTTVTPDVPLGGVFSVKTRYIFSWANENHTNLLIYHHVEWTGRSWMKSVIEKLSLSGLTATTKELIKELKEEIVKQTYFIDGPPAIKQPAKKKVKKVEPEVKNEPKAEIKASTVDVSSYLQQNITTAFFILFTIVTIILFMQIRLYGLLRKSNSIAETQLLLTLQLTDLQQKPQVEVQDNVFWNLIHSKLGRKLTSLEKLQFLTYQLQAIHKEKTDDSGGAGNTIGIIDSIPKYIRDLI